MPYLKQYTWRTEGTLSILAQTKSDTPCPTKNVSNSLKV